MRRTFCLGTAAAILIAAGLTPIISAHANTRVPPAQMGIVSVTGSPYSGGTVGYSFPLSATTTGTLTVKASIKGRGFKANFPVLSSTPVAGLSAIQGTSVSVPSSFTGVAKLCVNTFFNRKRIGSQTLLVTITAPPPPTGPTNVKLYDVGFATVVTLDGTVVPTTGMGTPLTYSWTQVQGPPVALSATDAAKPTFTTGSLTNFVDLTDELGVVPFNTLEIGEDNNGNLDTYGFQVVVSNGARSATGNVIVCVASLSPGLTTVPVGVKTHLQAPASEPSNSWTLVKVPGGSTAALAGANTRTPWLQPDVEGPYVVRDNVLGTNLTLRAATWTGVQFCAVCHGPNSNVGQADLVTPWSQTGHATMLQRGADGILDPGYNESCYFCHTVGYNKQALAPNGSFGDVLASTGWTLPQPLQGGDYAAMPTVLQNKANIQCESCHGPGSQHPDAPSLSVATCAPCHQENTSDNFRVGQWASSPHAQTDDAAKFSHAAGTSCSVRCHDPQGFIDLTKGLPLPATTTLGKMTCAVCHDPHNAQELPEEAHQVRVYDTVTLGDATLTNGVINPDGSLALTEGTLTLTNEGTSALCMSCHNARSLPYQNVGSVARPIPNYMVSLPHESTAAEVLNGVGAAAQGVSMGNSFHTYLAGCATCHMFHSNSNTVGNHTFSMTDRGDGSDNVAACNQCHTEPVTAFDFVALNGHDYDGDGTIDGVQTEVQGLLTILSNKFADVGVTVYDSYPFVNSTSYTTVTNLYPSEAAPIRRALWNRVLILREGSFGVHNTQFTVRLLQSSYTDLSTNCISSGTGMNGNPFSVDYPHAYVR